MRKLAWLVLWGVVGMGMIAQAGTRAIPLKNWVARDWPRTLLHYDLQFADREFFPGKVALLDPAGAPMPVQVVVRGTYHGGAIKSARVSFYTALAKGETRSFTLVSTPKKTTVPAQVTVEPAGDALVVAGQHACVQVPKPGGATFKTPVDAGSVPAPILGFRLSDGTPTGKGWLESERKVAAWSQRVVADGPLYKEYAYEVKFAPAGSYRARVRVEAELAAVAVAEEYDMGGALPGDNFFVLALNQGWKPDAAVWTGWVKAEGATYEEARGNRPDDMGVYRQPLDFSKTQVHNYLYPWRDYGTKAQWYGLYAAGAAESPFVGIIAQHVGAWRLPDSSLAQFAWTADGRVLAKMRLGMNAQGTPMNLFSTAQHDPDLPQSCGRRMWLLALGTLPQAKGKLDTARMDAYRNYNGFITLDDYKDWILTWPDGKISHPRVFITADQLQRLKANLDRCPGKAQIKDYYLLSSDPTRLQQEADRAMRNLDDRFRMGLEGYNPVFRQVQNDYEPIFLADSVLSAPNLPNDQREAIRAKAAACWYMTTHPDYYPRGAGVHLGNPNMTINRSMGFPLYATLLQDHPNAKAALDEMAAFTKWLTGYNITPSGVFRDSTHYTTYGPALFITSAAIALRNAGYDLDRWAPITELGQYFTTLESPPTHIRSRLMSEAYRAKLYRVLPSYGNSRDVPASQTELQLANLTAQSDPAFASAMLGAWEESGRYLGSGDGALPDFFWFYWPADVTPTPPARADAAIAGFGGVLRAFHGTPDELTVQLRMGYVQSHWASSQGSDQGSLAFYARGACLAPATGWMYSEVPAGFCHDSVLTFGTPLTEHPFGFVDNNIVDYGFLPSTSYLHGTQTFPKKWDKTGTYPGDFDWSRQVVLLRATQPAGPSYLVVRDSTQRPAPASWWYQWLMAKGEDVTPIPGGVRAKAAQAGVLLDITFAEPANAQVTIKGTKVNDFTEDYTQLSLNQPAGAGYLAVFASYKAGETPPTVEKLATGLLKVTTSESTDYVVCAADKPVVFQNAEVTINAWAGAVRIYKDRVLLVNASGKAGTLGYKGVTASGIGPFEQTVDVNPAPAVIRAGRTAAPTVLTPLARMIAVDPAAPPADPDVTVNGLKGYITFAGDKTSFVASEGIGAIGYKGLYVRAEAPFTCTFQPGKITLVTDGRARVFQMPIPENLVAPGLLPPYASLPEEFKKEWINWPCAVETKIDGVSRQNGWYDGKLAIGIPAGAHTVEIRPYTNPPVWKENAYTRLLP
jgi:hypothetical protein